MGVDITGKHKDISSYTFGAGQFAALRAKAAKAVLGDKYSIYTEWLETDDDTPKEELHKKCYALYQVGGDALYNFVCASDMEGKLTPKQTRELYNLLKDVDDNWSLQYLFYQMKDPEGTKKDFINLLKDCVDHKVGLCWY